MLERSFTSFIQWECVHSVHGYVVGIIIATQICMKILTILLLVNLLMNNLLAYLRSQAQNYGVNLSIREELVTYRGKMYISGVVHKKT